MGRSQNALFVQVGFEAHELVSAGFSVKELKEGGYTAAEELRAAGCIVRDLKDAGFAAGEEEHFCFKCKDGGDVMLCDFNDGACRRS